MSRFLWFTVYLHDCIECLTVIRCFYVILYYLHLLCHVQYAAVRSFDSQIVINLSSVQARFNCCSCWLSGFLCTCSL